MSIAGVVVLHDRVQAAVRRTGPGASAAPLRWHEVPWRADDAPDAVIAALRAELGPVGRVHLSIGLAHLHVKQVQLPPASFDDRRRMIALDPARWFAVADDAALAVALAPGEVVAMGCDAAWLERWVAAAASWAPVRVVEAAPVSVARALDAARVPDGTTPLEAGADEVGRLQRSRGAIVLVRRGRTLDDAPADALPASIAGAPAEAVAAVGAALAPIDVAAGALLTPALEQRLARDASRRWWTAVAAAAAAMLLCAQAFGIARERRLQWLEQEVAAASTRAAPGLEQLAQAARLDQEAALIVAHGAARASALAPLAQVAQVLPPNAVVQRVRMAGREWQVDGSAASSADVLARLAADSTWHDVRLLGPSTRVSASPAQRETFSIGFVVR
mgnify:CR=1 FL=1